MVTIGSQRKRAKMGELFVLENQISQKDMMMFILFIFIFIFIFISVSIIKKRGGKLQAFAIITQGLCPPVSQFQVRHICSKEHMSDDETMAAQRPGKRLNLDRRERFLEDDIDNTRTGSTSTPSSPAARKSSAMRISCLCAPTTHPGSFRCRYHRNSASVGSNLSDLANRKTASVGANLYQLGNTTSTKQSKRSREY